VLPSRSCALPRRNRALTFFGSVASTCHARLRPGHEVDSEQQLSIRLTGRFPHQAGPSSGQYSLRHIHDIMRKQPYQC
jgi:hypothetical protein